MERGTKVQIINFIEAGYIIPDVYVLLSLPFSHAVRRSELRCEDTKVEL